MSDQSSMRDARQTAERIVDGREMLVKAITAALEAKEREIERLRAGGCARDQRTTQFCAEAVQIQSQLDEAMRLLVQGREHIRQLVELANVNDATREILRRIGTSFNEFINRVKGGKS